MFFSFQFVWYPIKAVIDMVKKILAPRAPPREDIELGDSVSLERIDSNLVKDEAQINAIEVEPRTP